VRSTAPTVCYIPREPWIVLVAKVAQGVQKLYPPKQVRVPLSAFRPSRFVHHRPAPRIKSIRARESLGHASPRQATCWSGRESTSFVVERPTASRESISRTASGTAPLAQALGYGRHAQREILDTLSVKDVMATEVVTIRPDASLAYAARLLTERKIGCLPVVENGRLVGILTEGDFVALVARGDL
jgi:CBS domain protein